MIELVYVGAAWCGPCRMMKPILNSLEESGITVTRYDADVDKHIVQKYGVSGIPTMIIRKDGEDKVKLVGARDKATLVNAIQQVQSKEQ